MWANKARLVVGAVALAAAGPFVAGCDPVTTNAAIAGGVVGGTVLLAQAPGQEIEQVYYLGVFDPQDQLPPTVYRITVHGQASAMSNMKFGSGWVPAQFVDSLGTAASFGTGDNADVASFHGGQQKEQLANIKTGRRLMMFGPEGFREAPKDHRLVIVMGASPEKFFQAIDQAMENFSAERMPTDSQVAQQLADARKQMLAEQQRLDDLKKDIDAEMPAKQE